MPLFLASCGEDSAAPSKNGVNTALQSLSCKEKIIQDQRDSDGDGISDSREIYGWMAQVDNNTPLVFTDPLKADTDGDGGKELEEIRTNIFIGGLGSTIAVSGHPAHRDALVSVDAKGARVNGLSTSRHNTGWNYFEFFTVNSNSQFLFRDLQSSLWRGSLGLSGPLGSGVPVNCSRENKECLKVPEMRLIARFVQSPENENDGSDAIDLGVLLGSTNGFASVERSSNDQGRMLALRANDLDSDLANNSGALHLWIRQITTTDYPQRLPTAAEENALFAKICP